MSDRKTNEGALRLAPLVAERGKKAELADSLKADRGLVTRWVSGEQKPGAGHRLALQERYGIHWKLWDVEADAPEASGESAA